MHFKKIVRSSIHFAAGIRTGGTQALTVRHRNASTPSGPNAPSGHTLMQRPHPLQVGASFLPAQLSACRDSWTRRPVTTPLSNSRGPNRGLRRTVFLPCDPSPPAAATRFNRTTPCTLPSAILTGRYSGTGRADLLHFQTTGKLDGSVVQCLCNPEHPPGLPVRRHLVHRHRNFLPENYHGLGGWKKLHYQGSVLV